MSEEGFFWPFNGVRPDGVPFSLEPSHFLLWASEYHPEYVNWETGDTVEDFVASKEDADLAGMPELEGTVAVTINPEKYHETSYAEAARRAAERQADPVNRERFLKLAELFESSNFSVHVPTEEDNESQD